jgi:hypothetical protein
VHGVVYTAYMVLPNTPSIYSREFIYGEVARYVYNPDSISQQELFPNMLGF